jgi:hypothetical protein
MCSEVDRVVEADVLISGGGIAGPRQPSKPIVRSSLERKESRNRFHRSDYPAQDDKNWNWLRHIIITKSLEGMKITPELVEFPYLKPEVS